MSRFPNPSKIIRRMLAASFVLGLMVAPSVAAVSSRLPGPKVKRSRKTPPPPVVNSDPAPGSSSGGGTTTVNAGLSRRNGDPADTGRSSAKDPVAKPKVDAPVVPVDRGDIGRAPALRLHRAAFTPAAPAPRPTKHFVDVTFNSEDGFRAESGLSFRFR